MICFIKLVSHFCKRSFSWKNNTLLTSYWKKTKQKKTTSRFASSMASFHLCRPRWSLRIVEPASCCLCLLQANRRPRVHCFSCIHSFIYFLLRYAAAVQIRSSVKVNPAPKGSMLGLTQECDCLLLVGIYLQHALKRGGGEVRTAFFWIKNSALSRITLLHDSQLSKPLIGGRFLFLFTKWLDIRKSEGRPEIKYTANKF